MPAYPTLMPDAVEHVTFDRQIVASSGDTYVVNGIENYGEVMPGMCGLFLHGTTRVSSPDAGVGLDIHTDLTVEMLLNVSGFSPGRSFLMYGAGGGEAPYMIVPTTNFTSGYVNRLTYQCRNGSGAVFINSPINAGLQVGIPTLLHMVRDSADNSVSWYMNGRYYGNTGALAAPLQAVDSNARLHIGAASNTLIGNAFTIASVQVGSSILSLSDIQTRYDAIMGDLYPRRTP